MIATGCTNDDDEVRDTLIQILRVFTYEADDPAFSARYLAPSADARRTQLTQIQVLADPLDTKSYLRELGDQLRRGLDMIEVLLDEDDEDTDADAPPPTGV